MTVSCVIVGLSADYRRFQTGRAAAEPLQLVDLLFDRPTRTMIGRGRATAADWLRKRPNGY